MEHHQHEHHAMADNSHAHHAHEHTMHHQVEGHHNHDHHQMIQDFKKRFYVSLALTLPVLALSRMIQAWMGFSFHFPGDQYLLFVLSSIIFFYGGYPFLNGMVKEIKHHTTGMMTLIAVAITVAWAYSVAITFGLPGKDFYWEMATLIDIMLLGHWMEMRSVMSASHALELLVNMLPAEAHRVAPNGQIEDIKIEQLKTGDIILIKPGEKIPADGRVIEGSSYVNESMLTGESVPVKKETGSQVIGGAINGNGSLKVKVEHTGEESYLNRVITLVEEAQKAKSRMQNLSDRAAKWLTYLALAVGFITLLYWLLAGYSFVFALERMVTVMVITCPHALGLAIPLVVSISTTLAAQNGLLIRNRTAFEEARKISAILFDKTGTLTTGTFGVQHIVSLQPSLTDEQLLTLASAVEQTSEHPIASGIIRKAREMHLSIPKVEHFQAITGKGVEGIVDGKHIRVVSPGYLKEKHIPIPEETTSQHAGVTLVFVLINDTLAGYIGLADQLRPESKEAVAILKQNHIKVYMATGDNHTVAEAVSKTLQLDGFFAEVLPHEKLDIVKQLQEKGEFVAMTGDGVNDAPALAQADIGIAVGSGSDIAAETADIILVNSNPKDIVRLILFGKATYQKMMQNLFWATGYNAVAIPLAAGVLYKIGFLLSPAIGAILMSLSTIIVAVNAQLLKTRFARST